MGTQAKDNVFFFDVLPFAASLALLGGSALALDAALHFGNLVWIGKLLGIPGVLLIIFSFGYSLRKRKLITVGQPVDLLHVHEIMAWIGSLLILVHAGIHFNAWLAWFAVWAMLINVCSGLTGKFLLQRVGKRFSATQARLREELVPEASIDAQTHAASLALNVIRKWHQVHIPIASAFAVLALTHIAVVSWYWGFQ